MQFISILKNWFSFLFTVLMGVSCQNNPAKIATTTVSSDVEFIYKTLIENHPGVHNANDLEFMKIMVQAHQEAINKTPYVTSTDDHIKLLKQYARAFNDTHLSIWKKNFSSVSSTTMKYKKPFSTNIFNNDVAWITLPTFASNQKETEQLNVIIEQLPQYRAFKQIVFDVRGNGGGNSIWGESIIKALVGTDYAEKKISELNQNLYVDWRASKDNTEYVYTLIDYMVKEFGDQSDAHAWIVNVYQGMNHALNIGDHYFHEDSRATTPGSAHNKSPVNLCTAKIIVLIDGSCVSATLDFIDTLKALNNPVTLIGQPTNADSIYMEVRNVELPSKLGYLSYPIKVYRNRKRGHNQPYYPDILYHGELTDEEALKQWLLTKVIGQC